MEIKGLTKAQAWDILAKVIEETDDGMNNDARVLTRIRGTYYGIMARGLETDVEEDDGK